MIRFIPLIAVSVFITSCFTFTKQDTAFFSETQVKGDTVIHYHASTKEYRVKRDTLYYHWAKSGKIQVTQGGYHGRLLEGDYSMVVNSKLVTAGSFKNGLKHGIWKKWSNNKLTEKYTWKRGVLCGKYAIFDEKGSIAETGRYRKGKKVKPLLWWFGGKKR